MKTNTKEICDLFFSQLQKEIGQYFTNTDFPKELKRDSQNSGSIWLPNYEESYEIEIEIGQKHIFLRSGIDHFFPSPTNWKDDCHVLPIEDLKDDKKAFDFFEWLLC